MILPSIQKPKEPDIDYLQALKLIDRTRRQEEAMPKSILHRSYSIDDKAKIKSSYQFSSTLTPIGQKAMIKTYEDTLITHLANVYPSKRVANILPRLSTATFRRRLPKLNSQTNTDTIQNAQILMDNILNKNCEKDRILCDYVKWQHQWAENC
ncbi:unnamed protein product [Adineta ricciae]|uniref:Uncharacterized protein n=1 Tax=Adineta ricciae TaxID=249248 RepID=A0A815W650_ADIRI|nr:unnamed protein product [Adineta ricciae]